MDRDQNKLLDELGRLARQHEAEDHERFDERWQKLSAAKISEADDAALRAQTEESEETRLDYDALQPLGQGFHDRIAREWQAAPPAPIAGRRQPWTVGVYPWLAAAATLTLAVVGWQFWRGAQRPDLPVYTAELSGEARTSRFLGGDSGVPVFKPGSPFSLVLRPEQAVSDSGIERRLYLESSTGELSPWRVDLTISADGVVKVAGEVGRDLLIDPGDWTLVFVYGRSGRLPDSERLGSARPTGAWQQIRVPFVVEAGPPGQASSELPLEVEVAGCRAFHPRRRCVPTQTLTLWVRAPDNARTELRLGDRTVDDPGEPVDGGRRYRLPASAKDRDLEVRATSSSGFAVWRLELVEWRIPDWVAEARELFAAGELEAARDRIEGRLAGADPMAAALARSTLARVLMRLGSPVEEARELLVEAVGFHERSGDRIHLARDFDMLIYLALRHQDFSSARRHLERLQSDLAGGAPVEAQLSQLHSQVILGRKSGLYREALESARRELGLARRLGLELKLAQAQETTALVLQELGRFSEADRLFHQVEALAEEGGYERDPCSRVRLLNNHAWVLIRAADPALGDPLELHVRALEIAERNDCRATRKLDVLLDQALALAERGRTEEGRRAAQRADALVDRATPLQRLWREQIEGLLDLQAGDARDALGHFERLAGQSRARFFAEGEWLAQLGRARAYRRLGDAESAIDAFAAADTLLDADSLEVPLYAGRGRFMAERDESTRLYLATLLDAGRLAAALEVARRSRSRLLRGVHLSSRLSGLRGADRTDWDREIGTYLRLRSEIEAAAADDWQLDEESLKQAREARSGRWQEALQALDRAVQVLRQPNEALTLPPLGGQIVLAYHPLPEGWVGFGRSGDGISSHRFELPDSALSDPRGLAEHLLEPFRELLTEGRALRILPYGRLNEVDFHALPWNGDVLLSAHPVVYGLDLAGAPSNPPSGRALVVSDPRGDLQAAKVEGEAVARALESSFETWEVVRLEGGRATRSELSDLFGTAEDRFDLLHYAGHGAFESDDSGADGLSLEASGWESALLLAEDGRFTLGDVLALGDSAPAEVILSSCESARADDASGVANLGLAQAFVAAGSGRVVAATRPVGDQDTARFFLELYSHRASPLDLAAALRRGQLAWRQRDSAADWASFRLIEP